MQHAKGMGGREAIRNGPGDEKTGKVYCSYLQKKAKEEGVLRSLDKVRNRKEEQEKYSKCHRKKYRVWRKTRMGAADER